MLEEVLSVSFLTEAIVAGVVYDYIKCGVLLTADNLKKGLKNWIIGDSELIIISSELNKLELNDEMSESAIEKRIAASSELKQLIEKIKPISESNTIIQHHTGSGDNVGRDKIIN
jgi:hypothetical protein